MASRSISQLAWYNTAYSLWMTAYSIQQLIVTWILVGVLAESPERVGMAQMLIGVPALLFLLWGGAAGDRADPRKLLIRVHHLSALPPLLLAAALALDGLSFWLIVLLGLGANLLNSASNPTRHAILNRVAGRNLQVAIGLSTGLGAIAQMFGAKLGGELDTIGLEWILLIQATFYVIGGLVTARLHPAETPTVTSESAMSGIREGMVRIWRHRLARDIVLLHTVSGFFNAGAWMTAIPFIVVAIYEGGAADLANLTVVFYFGTLLANLTLVRFMPLASPGKLYLIMQLSRIAALLIIWFQPPEWVLWLAALYWGFNMGVTTTTSRLMVQEIAHPDFRTRFVSIYTLGQLSSTPIGALLLGFVIAAAGPLNALIPGMLVSLLIFALGVTVTGIWGYASPDSDDASG